MPSSLSDYHCFDSCDGTCLAYRIAGGLDDVPVVLLYALAARTHTWDHVVAALTQAGRPVIVADLRGHGRSARVKHYALADFASDTIDLLDRLGIAQADLIGHSLGGHAALWVAQQAPVRVRRIVVEDCAIPPRDAAEAQALHDQRQTPALATFYIATPGAPSRKDWAKAAVGPGPKRGPIAPIEKRGRRRQIAG